MMFLYPAYKQRVLFVLFYLLKEYVKWGNLGAMSQNGYSRFIVYSKVL